MAEMSNRTELEVCQDRLETAYTVENTLSMTISMLLAEMEGKDAQIARLSEANQKLSLAIGPVCQKCEIDTGLGYCRCDPCANN